MNLENKPLCESTLYENPMTMKGYSDRVRAAKKYVVQQQEAVEREKLRSLEYRPSPKKQTNQKSPWRARLDVQHVFHDDEEYPFVKDDDDPVIHFNESDLAAPSDMENDNNEEEEGDEEEVEHESSNNFNGHARATKIQSLHQKNKMMEELSRRHENEMKLLRQSKEHELKQTRQSYSDKITELMRQLDNLSLVNNQWKVRTEDSEEEVRVLKRKLDSTTRKLEGSFERQRQLQEIISQKISSSDLAEIDRINVYDDRTWKDSGSNGKGDTGENHALQKPADLTAMLLTPERVSQDSAAQRVRERRFIAEWKKRETEISSQLSTMTAKFEKATGLIRQLDVQKKDMEKKVDVAKFKYNTDQELQRMKEVIRMAKEETDRAVQHAKEMNQRHEELKKVNHSLRQMNDRYFSVLRASQETENQLLEKESTIKRMHQRNTELHNNITLLKQQRIRDHQRVSQLERAEEERLFPASHRSGVSPRTRTSHGGHSGRWGASTSRLPTPRKKP